MKVYESASIILLQWILEYLLCMYRIYCWTASFLCVILLLLLLMPWLLFIVLSAKDSSWFKVLNFIY